MISLGLKNDCMGCLTAEIRSNISNISTNLLLSCIVCCTISAYMECFNKYLRDSHSAHRTHLLSESACVMWSLVLFVQMRIKKG